MAEDTAKDPHPEQTKHLCLLECAVVWIISALLFVLVCYFFGWILFGVGAGVHSRLISTIRGANENWKFLLLVLVPLFYRPIRQILLKAKRLGPVDMTEETTPAEQTQMDYKEKK